MRMKSNVLSKLFSGVVLLLCTLLPIFFSKIPNITNYNNAAIAEAAAGSKVQNEVIASFSTDYSSSSAARKHNIRLALSALNNAVVRADGQFSFNKTVGARTEARGYQQALVINKGSYEKGVGGGVCQVSSTLYNAWLLAGLDVVSAKAHTLPASYVDLSRDATVSEWIDLELHNPLPTDVTILTSYDESSITVSIVGAPREKKYSLSSEILKVLPYDEEVIEVNEVGDDEYYIGKDGYISRLILTIVEGDRVIGKTEVRRDYYKPQNSVKIIRKSPLN